MRAFSNIIFLKFFLVGVFALTLFFPFRSFAAVQNVWGSAWASTIGWIRFGSSPSETATNYHVTYDPATGVLGGYAWSSNIGWVHAAPTGGYPAAPAKGATVNASGTVEGWMRITAIANASASEAGGWSGWIKMSGTNYGVTMNKGTGTFTGFAWSPEIGWIKFDGVSTSGNQPPQKPTLINPIGGLDLYTIPGWEAEPVTPHFEWSAFSDPDAGDAQSGYEIEVQGVGVKQHTGNTNACLYTGFDACLNTTASLQWDTSYQWRVRVFDQASGASPWSEWGSFRTPKHQRPLADFTYVPTTPNAKVDIHFTDQSLCYVYPIPQPPISPAVSCRTIAGVQYQWNFGDGATSTLRDPQHKYIRAGQWTVTLVVTDADGYVSEPKQQQITIGEPLPEWERITPF